MVESLAEGERGPTMKKGEEEHNLDQGFAMAQVHKTLAG
jgi:hypothetical protein